MIIREAIAEDIEQLLALEQCVIEYERPFNPSLKPLNATYYDLPDLISDDDSYLLLVEDDGQIQGTGYAQIRQSKKSLVHSEHAYLGFMYVSPEYRGRGINQKIIDQLIAWSSAKGINDHYLEVYSQNESAIAAYRKAGFSPCLMEMKLSL